MAQQSKLEVVLVGASVRRERELAGFEHVRDFASESANLAIGALAAAAGADPELAGAVAISLLDFEITWDHRALPDDAVERVLAREPDVLGLSCYCWSVDELTLLAERVRARRPGVFVVAGGPSAGPVAEALLRRGAIDAVARAEGEGTFTALLRALLDGSGLDRVPDLAYRSATGEPVTTARGGAADLATLPSPYLTGALRPTGRSILLETGRGCRYRCRFCSWTGGRGGLRAVPLNRVAAELRWALERGVRSIKLADTAINLDGERLRALVETIAHVDPEGRLEFTYFLKSDLLDDEQIATLARVPTSEIILGVESIDDGVRRAVGKPPFDPAVFERRLSSLAEVGPVTLSVIQGLPGDSVAGLERTLRWLVELDARRPGAIHVICLFWLALLPGSRLRARAEARGHRFMPRETPYLLESDEHSPDDLLRMARMAAEVHFGHPVVRLEYFHRDYLRQDAAEPDRPPGIVRVTGDRRPLALFIGPVTREGRDASAGCEETAALKAYIEADGELRRGVRIELVHLDHASGWPRPWERAQLEARDPALVLWWRPPDATRAARSLREAFPEARVILGGLDVATGLDSADAAIFGEGERPLRALTRRLLRGAPWSEPLRGALVRDAGGGVMGDGRAELEESLNALPSPHQWGFLSTQRPVRCAFLAFGRVREGGLELFDRARIAADLRWALEEGLERVRWTGCPLPGEEPAVLRVMDAVRAADPAGRLRHAFLLDPAALAAPELLAAVEAPVFELRLTSRAVSKGLLRRLRAVAPVVLPLGRRARDALAAWQARGALAGWTLDHVWRCPDRLVGTVRSAAGATAWVVVLAGADGAEVEVVDGGPGSPPAPAELDRLGAVVRRLLG